MDGPASVIKSAVAIRRNGPSAPARWLAAAGLLHGQMLDYGCGHGEDALFYGMDAWDPNHTPLPRSPIPWKFYDVVTCTYVLDVIPHWRDRDEVVDRVMRLLAPGGVAYFTVRRDVPQERRVYLPRSPLCRARGYAIYRYQKEAN